ncbi:hypothetical protein [Kribbella monticola]|uniref:hypothetical protein n=1 Tax=Kribbella monticola TaxID=2185285 RepID=UPI0013004A33|nr:hypothetical protein [Kribbella monticola]
MKKTSLVVLMAGLLSAGVLVPAQAAEPTDPAPTNVQISWKDETFQFVHVTWDEDVPRPNLVWARKPGAAAAAPLRMLAADAPNEVDLPMTSVRIAGSLLEIRVAAGTAAGATGPAGLSPAFDTIDAGRPVIESIQPSGTSTVHVTWKKGTPELQDTTPGDPLDRDLPTSFQPSYRLPDGTGGGPIGPRTANTSITFTGPRPPYYVRVAARNEWGDYTSFSAAADPLAYTTSIPSWVVADRYTEIRGTFTGPYAVRVTLQARNSATSPWYAVETDVFGDNVYSFRVASRGTRQYRIAFANSVKEPDRTAYFGGYSAPKTTTTQQLASASSPWVFRSSQPVASRLDVAPAVTGAAALQRWNGKTWVFVTNVAIKAGVGFGKLSAATVGTVAYRYYVPAHTFNGLSVAAAYSPNFTLRVS